MWAAFGAEFAFIAFDVRIVWLEEWTMIILNVIERVIESGR